MQHNPDCSKGPHCVCDPSYEYIEAHDDTGWWSPYVWPGADALMSWESVGMVVIGAVLVLWWGLDDVSVWDILMCGAEQ